MAEAGDMTWGWYDNQVMSSMKSPSTAADAVLARLMRRAAGGEDCIAGCAVTMASFGACARRSASSSMMV